jgi:hypothetical protein
LGTKPSGGYDDRIEELRYLINQRNPREVEEAFAALKERGLQ